MLQHVASGLERNVRVDRRSQVALEALLLSLPRACEVVTLQELATELARLSLEGVEVEDVVAVKTEGEKPPAMKKTGGGLRAGRPGIALRNAIETKKIVGGMSSLKGKF